MTEQRLERPVAGGTTTAAFPELPVGAVIAHVSAYPTVEGIGTAQASASAAVTIETGKTANLSLTLESAIDRLEVSPAPLSLTSGDFVNLAIAAKNSAGEIVLTDPAKITFARTGSSATGAPVVTVNSFGKVAAIVSGTGTITVTETESGKTVVIPVTVTPLPAGSIAQKCVAFQIDKEHSGNAFFTGLALKFPESPTWSVDLEKFVSYPLIAGGRVFVLTSNGGTLPKLYAFDRATGRLLWDPIVLKDSLPTSLFAGLTYENGTVFTLTRNGFLQAFEASTGKLLWTLKLADHLVWMKPPVVTNGILYASNDANGAGNTLCAIDANTGTLLWKDTVLGGADNSPTVSTDGSQLFVNAGCSVLAINARRTSSAELLWQSRNESCGAIGKTPVYSDGAVYVVDGALKNSNNFYNSRNGSVFGSFMGASIPAVRSGVGYLLNYYPQTQRRTFECIGFATNTKFWSVDGTDFVPDPIIIDNTVFICSWTGTVYGFDTNTGAQRWSGVAGSEIFSPSTTLVSGMGAGEGYLIVPASGKLTAWHLAGPK
jgi:outer membrane protein assembly factor BamB